jgi:putative membrane protein
MRRQFFCGAVGILAAVTLLGCAPYYYGRGYYGYYGYGPYQYPYYGSDPYGPYTVQPAPAPYTVPQSLSQTSYNFVINLALNNAYEIQAGQLAAQRSASPQLRQFAARVVSGNTVIDQDLTAALRRNGTPVVTPAALDPRHQAMIGDLSAVQGPEFDRRFVVQQIVAHREAIAMLQGYIQNSDSPALRQLAQQTLAAAQAGLQTLRMLPGAAGA